MLPDDHPDHIQIAFDDHRLVNNAGLILPATLALHLGLPQLVDRHLDLGDAPGRAHPGDKVMTLVASALAGGDCIDDADVLRTGGTAGGQILHGPHRTHDSLDGGVHRPGFHRRHHAGAIQRRAHTDRAHARHEDRPAFVPRALVAMPGPLRVPGTGLTLPWPAGAHRVTNQPRQMKNAAHKRADPWLTNEPHLAPGRRGEPPTALPRPEPRGYNRLHRPVQAKPGQSDNPGGPT